MPEPAPADPVPIEREDASRGLDELYTEVESRFGIRPSFFELARHEPEVAWKLFRITELGYLDNPMPVLLKDKLFTWLSRFCEVRYCVARHCAFLLGNGMPAVEALALLNEPMPDKTELPVYLRALEELPASGEWPDFDSEPGRCFRVACAAIILDPARAVPWLEALRRLLGPQRYEQLVLFLDFVRTAHFWTQVHPKPAFEPDLRRMLREHEALVEPLERTDEAVQWELGARLHEELQSLRNEQSRVDALRESEAGFRAIFRSAAVGIARVAPDGRWLDVNLRLSEMLGYTREELLTKTFEDVTHPEDLEPDLAQKRRLLAGEIEDYSLEKRYCRKDGSMVWAHLNVSLVRRLDGSPDYFISVHEDISARRQLAEERSRRAVAEAAQRSMDEFLSLVSHELRSPLGAILGYASVLGTGRANQEDVKAAAAVIERSAKAQLQIIEDLLDSGRIVAGKLKIEPKLVDLRSIVEDSLDSVRASAEAKHVRFVADLGPLPVYVLGDGMRLQQVLWNLLSNAVKFTPEGGRVELRIEAQDRNNVEISVADTGKGIAPEFLPVVFDRFWQADSSVPRPQGGLGLGLSLVKHLVEMHGGTVAAASGGIGRGATFRVTLPRAQNLPAVPVQGSVTSSVPA